MVAHSVRNYWMSFHIETFQPFDRQIKRLAKRYPSLKKNFIDFLEDLSGYLIRALP